MHPRQPRPRLSRAVALTASLLIALLRAVAAPAQDINSPEIIGGQEADPGEWPWQVALMRYYDLNDHLVCGGTIIAADWVVTAASCIDKYNYGNYSILAGIHDLAAPNPNFERRAVEVYLYPHWNDYTLDNDIALLKLSSPIAERDASGDTLPIRYAQLVPEDAGDLAGEDVIVTGWGSRTAGGDDYPHRLHEVAIPVATQAACAAAFSLFPITDNMLCAGTKGKGSCRGDKGGPLVYHNGGTWQLAGIDSVEETCVNEAYDHLGIYTRVARYVNWINSIVAPEPWPHNAYLPAILTPAPFYPLLNGDFEAGRGVGWTESAPQGWPLIYQYSGAPGEVPPHSGTWFAWLGGNFNESKALSQPVTILPGNKILSFYQWIDSKDTCGNDVARVLVNNTIIYEKDLCAAANSGGWQKVTINLEDFVWQIVTLRFTAAFSALDYSNWYIDNVVLQVARQSPSTNCGASC